MNPIKDNASQPKEEPVYITSLKYVSTGYQVDEFEDRSRGKLFKYNKLQIAIFKCDDKYFAMDNLCPHQRGPLYSGDIEDLPYPCREVYQGKDESEMLKKPAIICPWHGWAFFLEDGRSDVMDFVQQKTYAVRIEDGEIHVQIPIQEEVDF